MSELLTVHQYNTCGVQGNCGAALVSRLVGQYTNPTKAEYEYKRGIEDKRLKPIQITDAMNIKQLLQAIAAADGQSTPVARARPYSIEWAFADVLQALTAYSPSICGMTDTENGAGDGHAGPFATRHFADWLTKHELCTDMRYAVGHRKSYEGSYNVYGWWYHFDKDRCQKYIKETKAEIRRWIEEANNDDIFREIREAQEAANLAVSSAIDAGWTDYEREHPGEDQAEPRGGEEAVPASADTGQFGAGSRARIRPAMQFRTANEGGEQVDQVRAAYERIVRDTILTTNPVTRLGGAANTTAVAAEDVPEAPPEPGRHHTFIEEAADVDWDADLDEDLEQELDDYFGQPEI